jgi:hypothetical protein
VSDAARRIEQACAALCELLVEKNRRYGDAVGLSTPAVGVFAPECKADPTLTVRTRLDEKLARLMSAQADEDEDVILDLAGLLVILLAHRGYGA